MTPGTSLVTKEVERQDEGMTRSLIGSWTLCREREDKHGRNLAKIFGKTGAEQTYSQ